MSVYLRGSIPQGAMSVLQTSREYTLRCRRHVLSVVVGTQSLTVSGGYSAAALSVLTCERPHTRAYRDIVPDSSPNHRIARAKFCLAHQGHGTFHRHDRGVVALDLLLDGSRPMRFQSHLW